MKKIIYIIAILGIIGLTYWVIQQAKADIYGSSLVGWWRFDTNSDIDGVTKDDSGSGNNGNLVNIASSTFYSYGKIGQGFDFDGTNDWVDLGNPASLQITGAMTLAAWVWLDTANSADEIITRTGNITINGGYRLGSTSGGSGDCYVATTATTGVVVTATSAFSTGRWYHLACVYTPSTSLALFINGVQNNINTTSIPASQRLSTALPFLGTRNNQTSFAFDGKIDDARVYNRALTAGEIAQLYNMGMTQFNSFSDF